MIFVLFDLLDSAQGLLSDVRGARKFEGSDIIRVNGSYWVIFDSLFTVGKFASNFALVSSQNQLLGVCLAMHVITIHGRPCTTS